MLNNCIRETKLFKELSALLSATDYQLVDAVLNETANSVTMSVFIYSKDREVDTSDLSKVYNVIYPRYQVILGNRDLSLEVSSPGLQRNIKDYYEFNIFKGKLVRVYSAKYSSYIEGYINEVHDDSLLLNEVIIIDKNENLEQLEIAFSDIQKAKLSFRWEEKNNE